MSETNGDAFSDAIDSMWIYISNIHSNLNYFSARPEGTFKTISFGLKPSTNRTEFNNNFVSVFPSQPNPMFQIFVQLSNGTIKHYQQKLTTQLNAGTRTTVNLSMDGVLLEEGDTGEFQIDKWKEQHDSIHISLNLIFALLNFQRDPAIYHVNSTVCQTSQIFIMSNNNKSLT